MSAERGPAAHWLAAPDGDQWRHALRRARGLGTPRPCRGDVDASAGRPRVPLRLATPGAGAIRGRRLANFVSAGIRITRGTRGLPSDLAGLHRRITSKHLRITSDYSSRATEPREPRAQRPARRSVAVLLRMRHARPAGRRSDAARHAGQSARECKTLSAATARTRRRDAATRPARDIAPRTRKRAATPRRRDADTRLLRHARHSRRAAARAKTGKNTMRRGTLAVYFESAYIIARRWRLSVGAVRANSGEFGTESRRRESGWMEVYVL